ncbi:MAG: TIR domain-containing protein [Firmicutes bacterium]|nr:TIR domain-containing protein [Bacillota bacterium]
MKIKTRGDSSPQGKARVFFAGSRDGFERYFDAVSDDILKCQNCAIYYPDPYDEIIPEEDLMEMQLFAVLVTDALFAGEDPVVSRLLPFCKKYHKPVLPILCENGYPQRFNELFDKMQYLDPFSQDATAVSYQQKLEKYLASVLVSDELASKVRDAFDAYVFLSYRKKDRAYAQKLMRLIHSEDALRDIAIWYDEFLVPGHSFSASIEEAFQKSDLFALVVTPNLLEEGNYVKEVEYKMAAKEGAAILPAELVKTDRSALEADYPGIPPCISAEEPEKIRGAVLEHLKDIALSSGGDPQHEFFIGLAYLDGIDVEVDAERGYRMIRDAAEAGLPEAIDKTAAMLRNGEAVERDLEEALLWQRKLAECRKKEFEDDPSRYLPYAEALEGLAVQAHDLEHIDEAKEVWNRILDIDAEESFWSRRYCQLAHRMLGDIAAFDELDEKAARSHYVKSTNIMMALAEEASTVGTWTELAMNFYSAGQSMLKSGDLEHAEQCFREALAITKNLLESADETNLIAEAQKNCIRMDIAAAEVCAKKGGTEEAAGLYSEALSFARKMQDEYESAHTQRDLLITLNKLGDFELFTRGNAAAAQMYYTESFFLTDDLHKNVPSVTTKEDLAFVLNRLGEVSLKTGDAEEALTRFRTSQKLLNELVERSPSAGNRAKLANADEKISLALKALGRTEEAAQYIDQSVELRSEIAEATGSLQEQRDLSINLLEKGDQQHQALKTAEAEQSYRKAAAIRQAILDKTGTAEAKRDLAVIFERLGNIAVSNDAFDEALSWYEKERALFEEIFDETGSDSAAHDVSVAFTKLGTLYRKMKREDKAMEFFEKARQMNEDEQEEVLDPVKLRSLLVDNMKLGEGMEAQGKLDEAQKYYDKLLPMAEKLLVLNPGKQATRDHYLCFIKSADVAYKKREFEKALELYTEAKERAADLRERIGGLDVAFDVMYLDQQLGFVEEDIASGGTLEAPVYAEEGINDMESLMKFLAAAKKEQQAAQSAPQPPKKEAPPKKEEKPAKKKWFEFWK